MFGVLMHREVIVTPDEMNDEFVRDGEGYIEVCLGFSAWQSLDGRFISESDAKVSGEVWRVHLSDADPFPSRPHAHCVGGSKRYIGCKLHLGTAELFKGRESLNRRLDSNQFSRLIELIRPKFPGITLPLNS